MTTETILFLFATIVILLSLIFLSGTYLYLYFRDKKMVRLAKSSVKGTVVGYSNFQTGKPPIVEYTVDGTTYGIILKNQTGLMWNDTVESTNFINY